MKIIIGLGNPGFRYRNTRHNVGFMVIKALARKYRLSIKKKGYQGVYGVGRIEGQEVMLFEPLTYMNLSGQAVHSVCSSNLYDKEDLIVISDDFNLELGRLRIREKGSSGGHNGLKSIISVLGSDFPRLRVGVGAGHAQGDMSSFVLAPFLRREKADLESVIDTVVESIETWLTEGIKPAMSRYNA